MLMMVGTRIVMLMVMLDLRIEQEELLCYLYAFESTERSRM